MLVLLSFFLLSTTARDELALSGTPLPEDGRQVHGVPHPVSSL